MLHIFKKIRLTSIFLLVLLPVFCVSCIGASLNTTINSNGSGTVTQVYRISQTFLSLGISDETDEGMKALFSKEEMEKTVDRISGLHLVSYSIRDDDKDRYITTECAFDTPEALAEFIGSGKPDVTIDMKEKKVSLFFEAEEKDDNSLDGMMDSVFDGYDFFVSFTVPGQGKAVWIDKNGENLKQYPGTFSVKNNTVDLTVPMKDVFELENSMYFVISW